jgi:hypothetical protein
LYSHKKTIPEELINYKIMNLVSGIHEYKGKQELFIEAKPDVLDAMLEIAKVQSTGASNRIEGIFTSDERLDALVKLNAEPRNRSEREIEGYREVLSLIHENYDYMFIHISTPKEEKKIGNVAEVTAVANKDYIFVNWINEYGFIVSASAKYTFTVDSDRTLIADFQPKLGKVLGPRE